MARLVPARAFLAALFLGAGSAALGSGFLGIAAVPARIGPVPGAVVFEVAGGVLLILGLVVAMRAFEKPDGPLPSVPAHVAFTQRQVQPLVAPPRPAPRVAKPASPASEIDEQIRECTRKINRAAVMLATGKLSNEGYARYVETLKKERGQLERERVKREFKTS